MVHEQWFDLAVPRSVGTKEQSKPVLSGLWPGKVVSSFLIYVLRGILFQKMQVSLQLNTC